MGGLGLAPGANIGAEHALFEATHGTAPKYADKDMINPQQRDPLGRDDAGTLGLGRSGQLIERGMTGAIAARTVTYDLHRQMDGATKVGCSEFGAAVIGHMD